MGCAQRDVLLKCLLAKIKVAQDLRKAFIGGVGGWEGSSTLIQTLGAEQVGVGRRTVIQVPKSSLSQRVGLRGW